MNRQNERDGKQVMRLGEVELNEWMFFNAWEEAVGLIGPHCFYPATPKTAETKWDLIPDIDLIEELFDKWSPRQQAFATVCISIYNERMGASLYKKMGQEFSLYSQTFDLDEQRLEIIAELFIFGSGW